MTKKIFLATLGYLLVTFALGASWHFAFFPELYHRFGIYSRAEPIIPLGVLSMVPQGLVMALIYPRWYRGEAPLAAGLKFGLLMGLFLFSVSTLANAAKINVNGLGSFILVQAAFHALQFAAAGAVFGFIFGRLDMNSRLSSIGAARPTTVQSSTH
ncbi:MAG TPA: hypothetical protein VHF69_05145 [Candidatus Synoicihabitans sp.]|nr:hypothetical protein [Candidatus Synoicihabitans sp.]